MGPLIFGKSKQKNPEFIAAVQACSVEGPGALGRNRPSHVQKAEVFDHHDTAKRELSCFSFEAFFTREPKQRLETFSSTGGQQGRAVVALRRLPEGSPPPGPGQPPWPGQPPRPPGLQLPESSHKMCYRHR